MPNNMHEFVLNELFLVMLAVAAAGCDIQANAAGTQSGDTENLADGSISSLSLASRKIPLQPGFFEDLAYGSAGTQNLNLFIPEQPARDAVVLLIHGGGFCSGDKHQDQSGAPVSGNPRFTPYAKAIAANSAEGYISLTALQCTLARAGYISVNMNYRLQPNPNLIDPATGVHYPYPDLAGTTRQLDDINTVVAFIRDRFPDRRIILFGHSAGAALALLFSLEHPGLVSQVSTFGAVYDTALENRINPAKRLAECSPGTFLKIMHGELDSIIPPRSAREFCAGLTVPHRFVGFPDSGHYWGSLESRANGGFVFIANPAWTAADYNRFVSEILSS